MKFTEEQYQKIVSKYLGSWGYDGAVRAVIDYVEYLGFHNYEEAILLAMPTSREWAHDKFVEKEKKYYWNSIKTDLAGHHSRLFRSENDNITSYSRSEPANNINEDEQLTESEIKEWGYNPEMFDREEIKND
ncbi:MAG: hypothetical protein ABF477_03865 [Leuconostoc pseudomesenteroides]